MTPMTSGKSLLRWIDAVEAEIISGSSVPTPYKVQAKLMLAGADKHARNVGFLDKCCQWIPGARLVLNPLRRRESLRCSTLIRRSALIADLSPIYLMPSKVLIKKPG